MLKHYNCITNALQLQENQLLLQSMLLYHFLILIRLIHPEVIQEIAAVRHFAQKSASGRVIFLVTLKVLRESANFLGDNGNLHLRGAGVFRVRAIFCDNRFLLCALERHRE